MPIRSAARRRRGACALVGTTWISGVTIISEFDGSGSTIRASSRSGARRQARPVRVRPSSAPNSITPTVRRLDPARGVEAREILVDHGDDPAWSIPVCSTASPRTSPSTWRIFRAASPDARARAGRLFRRSFGAPPRPTPRRHPEGATSTHYIHAIASTPPDPPGRSRRRVDQAGYGISRLAYRVRHRLSAGESENARWCATSSTRHPRARS